MYKNPKKGKLRKNLISILPLAFSSQRISSAPFNSILNVVFHPPRVTLLGQEPLQVTILRVVAFAVVVQVLVSFLLVIVIEALQGEDLIVALVVVFVVFAAVVVQFARDPFGVVTGEQKDGVIEGTRQTAASAATEVVVVVVVVIRVLLLTRPPRP